MNTRGGYCGKMKSVKMMIRKMTSISSALRFQTILETSRLPAAAEAVVETTTKIFQTELLEGFQQTNLVATPAADNAEAKVVRNGEKRDERRGFINLFNA